MSRICARSVVLALGLLAVVGGAVGCSSSGSYYDYTNTNITATTQTFTGSLINSADAPVLRLTHTFTTTYQGTVTITLTANDASSVVLGMGIGVYDTATSTCGTLMAWNNSAVAGTAILGNAIAGNFCVQVYDVGSLTSGATANYTLTVTHY